MKKIRTIIVEDEQPARKRLILALRMFPELEIIAEAENGLKAVELIQKGKPDLIFLDVQLPLLNGFEVLSKLTVLPKVIFTTAYDAYALKAFEVHAVDYLLKPYSKERLAAAVNRILEEKNEPDSELNRLLQLLKNYRQNSGYLKRICIRTRHVYQVLPVEEIEFFKIEKEQLYLVKGRERYPFNASLCVLEKQLDSALFFRVHRNAIANLSRIQRIIPWGRGQLAIEFTNGEKLFIGRTKIRLFKQVMGLEF